jgi:phage gp29-like protein
MSKSAAKAAKKQRPAATSSAEIYKAESQPSVRVQTLFTPPMLRSLELQVDSGELWRLADLCEQILADDRVSELLESLVGEVLGSELTFEVGPRQNAGSAEKSEELEEDWPIGFDDDELTSLAIWTLMCGVGFAKIERWVSQPPSSADATQSTPARVIPVLRWWHPKHFCYDYTSNTWQVRDQLGIKTPIHAGDGTWIIATRRGEVRPWASGLWRGLSRWWMLKQYAVSDWGVHSEKASKLVATSPDGATFEDRASLVTEIFNAAKDATIALPIGFDLKLLELSADTRMIYEAQINAANESFAIGIAGQNLTTKVEGGSHAAAQVHENKENKKQRYVAQFLGKLLSTQVLTWWAQYNFGDRALAPYPKYHTEPPDDVLSRATALKMLGDALNSLKTAGYQLSTEQIEEAYGVELTEVPPPPMPTLGPNGLPVKPPPGTPGSPGPQAAPPRKPPPAAPPAS